MQSKHVIALVVSGAALVSVGGIAGAGALGYAGQHNNTASPSPSPTDSATDAPLNTAVPTPTDTSSSSNAAPSGGQVTTGKTVVQNGCGGTAMKVGSDAVVSGGWIRGDGSCNKLSWDGCKHQAGNGIGINANGTGTLQFLGTKIGDSSTGVGADGVRITNLYDQILFNGVNFQNICDDAISLTPKSGSHVEIDNSAIKAYAIVSSRNPGGVSGGKGGGTEPYTLSLNNNIFWAQSDQNRTGGQASNYRSNRIIGNVIKIEDGANQPAHWKDTTVILDGPQAGWQEAPGSTYQNVKAYCVGGTNCAHPSAVPLQAITREQAQQMFDSWTPQQGTASQPSATGSATPSASSSPSPSGPPVPIVGPSVGPTDIGVARPPSSEASKSSGKEASTSPSSSPSQTASPKRQKKTQEPSSGSPETSSPTPSETSSQSLPPVPVPSATSTALGTATTAVGSSGCNSNPQSFATMGDNKYWPLHPGTSSTLGPITITTLKDAVSTPAGTFGPTKTVNGVETRVIQEEEPNEHSFNYYAQAADGCVWYFGEDVFDGSWKRLGDGWVAGQAGAQPGIMMPANPVAGQEYDQERASNAKDHAKHTGIEPSYTTPAGTFSNVLVVDETSALEPGVTDTKRYAPGVGVIQDVNDKLTKTTTGATPTSSPSPSTTPGVATGGASPPPIGQPTFPTPTAPTPQPTFTPGGAPAFPSTPAPSSPFPSPSTSPPLAPTPTPSATGTTYGSFVLGTDRFVKLDASLTGTAREQMVTWLKGYLAQQPSAIVYWQASPNDSDLINTVSLFPQARAVVAASGTPA